MSTTHGVITGMHLTAPRQGAPKVTYTSLMQSSTRLYPERNPYVTQRSVNDAEGVAMRRQWDQAGLSVRTHQDLTQRVSKSTMVSTRQQHLDLACGSLYI